MKKATNCSEYLFQKVFGIFIFLTFYILTGLHAQDTREGKIGQNLNSESEDEISAQDPSPEKLKKQQRKNNLLKNCLLYLLIKSRMSKRWNLVFRQQNHRIILAKGTMER